MIRTELEALDWKHSRAIYELVSANKKFLRVWLPWVDRMNSVDFIDEFISGSLKRNDAETEYSFVIKFQGIVAGRIGLYKVDKMNKIGEIGYWLAENYQGQGLALRCTDKLSDFAFKKLKLNRLEIKCGVENTVSRKIPEKLGFKREGILRQAEMIRRKFTDLVLYSKLKGD